MTLRFLEVSNLRIIEQLSLAPHLQTNLFVGPNASGKTSLLEGIHLLATGRSFRTRQVGEIRRKSSKTLTVWGHVEHQGETIRTNVEYGEAGRRIVVAGAEKPSNAHLAELIPIQAVFPGALQEFWQHSYERRRLLDWGLFHTEPGFYPLWRRYRRLLKQRNAALQSRAAVQVCTAWDVELATLGEQLHQWRRDYMEQWTPHVHSINRALFGPDPIALDMELKSGWPAQTGLREALLSTVSKDQHYGYTHMGPQRGDIALLRQGQPLRTECSHGQQRLLFIGLKLAQLVLLAHRREKAGVLLIDDLYTELDPAHTERLLALLLQLKVQSFITTTLHEPLSALRLGKLFHVERGRLKEH